MCWGTCSLMSCSCCCSFCTSGVGAGGVAAAGGAGGEGRDPLFMWYGAAGCGAGCPLFTCTCARLLLPSFSTEHSTKNCLCSLLCNTFVSLCLSFLRTTRSGCKGSEKQGLTVDFVKVVRVRGGGGGDRGGRGAGGGSRRGGGRRGGLLQRRAARHALAHERCARGASAHVAARPEHHRGRRLRAHHALAYTLARLHRRAAH